MASVLLDIAWRLATWGIVALGVALALHALLTDQIIGLRRASLARRAQRAPRLRCPGGWTRLLAIIPLRAGCWYDMAGTPIESDGRYLCPECGRRSQLRQLNRCRRQPRLALLALAIILFGLAARYSREVYRNGWRAVPDRLLVLVPFDERDWLENDLSSGHWALQAAAIEIVRRDDAGELSPWASDYLGRRIRARYARDSDYGVDAASQAAFARLESTPFTEGIANRPFSEAIATIAATAGVPLDLDAVALGNTSIDPDRRITIPQFGMMSCEQALTWACDRARASRGWAYAEWTLSQGRVLVADDTSTSSQPRVLVLMAPASRRFSSTDLQWLVRFTTLIDAPRITATGAQPIQRRGGAIIVTTTSRRLLDAQRVQSLVEAAPGFKGEARDALLAFDQRLTRASITPVEADEDLDTALVRIRDEAGIPLSLDGWGVDPYETLVDAMVERGLIRVDRTAHNADPFNDNPTDELGNPIEPIAGIPELLSTFSADSTHDGERILVGLRASRLLAIACAYPLPVPDASRREVVDALIGRILDSPGSSGFWRQNGGDRGLLLLNGDRLVVVAPPAVQARVAKLIEDFLAQHATTPGSAP